MSVKKQITEQESAYSFVTGTFRLSSGETAYTALNNNLPGIVGGLSANTNVPKAYLFYLLYNSTYSSYQVGFQMVSNAAQNAFEKLKLNVVIPSGYEGGYLYTYVANESNIGSSTSVYFDDMTVRHWQVAKSLQVAQVNEYYPFGLAINPLAYNRSATFKNDYKFQGQENDDDFGLNWDSFKWRNHQADIGRFFNIDPLAEKYVYNSPYAFSENAVVAHRELEGLEKESVNKKEADKQRKATEQELQRRKDGNAPNYGIIPNNDTNKTPNKSTSTDLKFQGGDKDKKQVAESEPLNATRPLEEASFSDTQVNNTQSASKNIFPGNLKIPKGSNVESATLNLNIEAEVVSPQILIIQQGNFGSDSNSGAIIYQGAITPGISNPDPISLNGVSPNTSLSVRFEGGTGNKVTVSGTITVTGTKPKERK